MAAPAIQCEDSFNGSVSLRVKFTPLHTLGLETGGGCVSDTFNDRIRQSQPTVDKCGRLAAQAAGVSSAVRWSGAFALTDTVKEPCRSHLISRLV
jgi:hypothetical protein